MQGRLGIGERREERGHTHQLFKTSHFARLLPKSKRNVAPCTNNHVLRHLSLSIDDPTIGVQHFETRFEHARRAIA